MLTLTKIKIKSNNLNKDSLVPDFKGGGSVTERIPYGVFCITIIVRQFL